MFTGIVTDIGTITRAEQRGDLRCTIATSYDTATLAHGASIACSGACLTVVDRGPGWFAVDISKESVARTAPGMWHEGARLNLERALCVGDELGGHIVTGHVDGVGQIFKLEPVGDSIKVTIAAPTGLAPYIAAKGSVALDGVSLTVNTVGAPLRDAHLISVNIIPHTRMVTTLGGWAVGQPVNIEIDVLARYLGRMRQLMG